MTTRPQADADAALEPGFSLGELRVSPVEGEIAGPGGVQKLDPKVMGVLVTLAGHANHVVTRDELLARLWPGAVVTDDALSRCLYELRRHLVVAGGSEECRALIETMPKRGYRLNAEVTPLAQAPAAAAGSGRRSRWALWAAAASVAIVAAFILGRPEPGERRTSIAVMPFADLSETQDQAYLADGVAEEILDNLSQSTDLRVIARTSSFAFRGRNADIAEIARTLDVTHVLEGSVRRAGDDLRVTAQLIATRDSTHLWSTTFERKLGDLFAIQDEIAAAVATALHTTLELRSLGPAPTPKFAAFDLVKQGESLYYRRAPGDIQRSVELFEQAVQVDPSYARAWADLAGAYSLLAWSVHPPNALLRAKQGEAALRAVELEPALALAQARLAQYYHESGDGESRDRHFALALKLNPDDPLVLGYLASIAVTAGDLEAAIAAQRRALLRDPMSTAIRQNLGVVLMASGRLDEALECYRTLLEINPDAGADIAIEMARIPALLGRYDEAAEAAARLPAGKYRDQAMALLERSPAHRAEADAALARLESHVPVAPLDLPEHTIMDAVRLAEVYAFRGRGDQAFETLARKQRALAGIQERSVYIDKLRQELRVAPFLKPLHADPRWAALLAEPA
jgi:TolB-like protein/DNA-binding winged helix-turn-helix (wHTH) protein/Tfp pilus assembly protein PilF